MVAGALLLGVGLTLFVVNVRATGHASPQTTQSAGPALTVAPPTTQASVSATAAPVAPSTTSPQTETVKLGVKDFAAACQSQHDASAAPKITPTDNEPPSFWVKCFVHGANVGGISLDQYCSTIKPGTESYNPKKYDYTATKDGWRLWECVPA
jgi:hypothetical protein